MAILYFLNGPNLNCLGQRETEYYGSETLSAINDSLSRKTIELGHVFTTFQSNSESELIDSIHACATNGTDLIIFNPAAFTHTSIALRDALLIVSVPFIEVHLSNIWAREPFRRHSYFSDIAIGSLSGFGSDVYQLALSAAHFALMN